jgi:hypothetical protein
MKALIRRSLGAAAVAVAATVALPSVAHAATHSVGCSDHNKQAAITTTAPATICFAGTGADWEGYIAGVKAIWSGPYYVVAGQNGTDNPIEVAPHTTYTLKTPLNIQFIQLI